MKTKHTPGPWKLSFTSAEQARSEARAQGENTDGGGASGSISANDPNNRYGRTIVFLPHHRDVKEDIEREANALLIAAAPELLEALAEMVHQQTEGPYFHEDEHTPLCPINKARAVIEKATL